MAQVIPWYSYHLFLIYLFMASRNNKILVSRKEVERKSYKVRSPYVHATYVHHVLLFQQLSLLVQRRRSRRPTLHCCFGNRKWSLLGGAVHPWWIWRHTRSWPRTPSHWAPCYQWRNQGPVGAVPATHPPKHSRVHIRPVSMGVSWLSFQHTHILETVQKSFIPMKLSLLPWNFHHLSSSIQCHVSIFNVHETL
jgi:hypothetical protein